jgi:hypothetical protein
MRSLQEAARANPANSIASRPFSTNLRLPESSHRHASRDALESLAQRWSRPQLVSSVEFAFRGSSHLARPPVIPTFGNQVGMQSACDRLSRATGLAALPSPAAITRCGHRRFALLYQRAIHIRGLTHL